MLGQMSRQSRSRNRITRARPCVSHLQVVSIHDIAAVPLVDNMRGIFTIINKSNTQRNSACTP